ncbi:MAG: tmk [Solimicrobium sp.]|jgi:dTMP kinase|nr:tmk [Solimicrobium sp.]
MNKAKLITFEGIDGAGKSTHIPFVVDLLKAAGHTIVSTREPGGTELGEQLRTLLLREPMHLETEALLMFAARREHIDKVIAPALARGDWVISDRFTDASFAYQGGGRHLAIEKLEILEKWVHSHLQPDLTLLFDVPLEVARARLKASREPDKFEQEQNEFFANTRTEYLRRAAEFPARFKVIDSNQAITKIQEELREILQVIIDKTVINK